MKLYHCNDIERRKVMKSLKELRDHNNLSRKEVAQHIGVSDRVYAYYEQGRTLPAKYVKPLANLFGISCDEFLENNTDALDWEKEFGCIERTERLVLPTWEEVSRDLQNVLAGNYTIKEFDNVSLEYIKYRNGNYAVIGVYKYDDRLELEATKENYIKACRKCVELFKREKE